MVPEVYYDMTIQQVTVRSDTDHEHVIKEEDFSLMLSWFVSTVHVRHVVESTVADEASMQQRQWLTQTHHAPQSTQLHAKHSANSRDENWHQTVTSKLKTPTR